ncbi:ATP-grasp domain-containing protein [Patescibacteria group bacterium]|nr:ATP-grasp domain-containing protein [Patescibacteria group bacterium]
MRILIITGGTTSERRISLMSAKCVKKGLKENSHRVKLFDLKKGSISKNLVEDFDVVFPVLHGEEGEGGNLQKKLSTFGIPFIGGDPKGFQQGWYKISFKEFCDKEHILTSPWKKIKSKDDIVEFGFPCVLKSSNGGSSKEVVILKSAENLKNNLCRVLLKSGLPLFVEKYLPGIEVTVAILKDKALPVIEIIPPKEGWFDYKNKYWGKTDEIPNAPSLTAKLKKIVQEIALRIHKTLKLGHYSRIDFIISEDQPYVLEVNTIPGLTASSLFPKAAAAVGLTFPKLLDKMVKSAYEDK